MLDVFFLSYDEPFADENFELLTLTVPIAKRVHGVDGILNAHKECARRSNTHNFYVVDADAVVKEDFCFSWMPTSQIQYAPDITESDCVHVWLSENPVNGLVYGHGGVKCFPTAALLDITTDQYVDMTTSLGPLVVHSNVSNVTMYNTDPYNAWKTAFRECVKLASGIMPNDDNVVRLERLRVWQECADGDFGYYSKLGAIQGADFGMYYNNNSSALAHINDFAWLSAQFERAV